MRAQRLDEQQLAEAMKDGLKRWLSDNEVVRGIGRLVARVTSTGSLRFYFRYCVEGKQRYVPIGPYCHQERDGFFTLAQARARARELSAIHRDPARRDVRRTLGLDRPRRPATASAANHANRKDIAGEAVWLQCVSERERAAMRLAKEIEAVVARIQEAIKHYGLTAQDLGLGKKGRPGRKASPLKGRKLAVKYADGRGNEWSGVGRRPKWFVDALKSGKAEADMRVK